MRWVFAVLALAWTGCASRSGAAPDPPVPPPATPVKVQEIAMTTLRDQVTAPGRTVALREQKIHAPFEGVLTQLRVADGDRVERGQVIGEMLSQNSKAALDGARAMLLSARTPEERSDAERAVAVAESHQVRSPIRAPATGVVASHQASEGDLLSAHDEILAIADERSIVFVANVPQSALPRVRPDETAEVALAARPSALPGVVRAVLPAGPDLTAPVRIELQNAPAHLAPGLFGYAHVLVGRREGATVVPAAAVLRDDISGIARVALVEQGAAHWVAVEPGLSDEERVEIRSPPLAAGSKVIVQGQVGLPEGAKVKPEP